MNYQKGNRGLKSYTVEITDTYGGEPNYCWVRRFEVSASSILGAIKKVGTVYSKGWTLDHKIDKYSARYNKKGAPICCFLELKE